MVKCSSTTIFLQLYHATCHPGAILCRVSTSLSLTFSFVFSVFNVKWTWTLIEMGGEMQCFSIKLTEFNQQAREEKKTNWQTPHNIVGMVVVGRAS